MGKYQLLLIADIPPPCSENMNIIQITREWWKDTNKILVGGLIGLFLAIGLGVWANEAYKDVKQNITVNGTYYAGEVDIDQVVKMVVERMANQASETFGAGTTFKYGLDIPSTAEFTNEGTTTLSGNNTLSGTTTIPILDASYQTALDFTRATTTHGGATETELVIASVQNTGNDLLCTDTWVDISTAVGIFAYDIRVGTSTTATSSNAAHLIDATTLNHEIGSSTTDILSKEDDEGTSSNEVWDWNNGEYATVTMIYDAGNVTSSDSLTAQGGNLGAGNLHINCRSRY